MMNSFISMPFRSSDRPRWYNPLGYLAAVLGVAAATGMLRLAEPVINLGSVYLIYLVVVVAVAVGWGLAQGVLASFLAFLAANFFFIQPRFTFTVADFQDLLALVIFLALATLTSQLVAVLRREALEARRGQQTAAALYALSRSINSQHDMGRLLEEAAGSLRDVLSLAMCTIKVEDPGGPRSFCAVAGQMPGGEEGGHLYHVPIMLDDQAAQPGEITAVLGTGQQPLPKDAQQLLAAFAGQLNVAIERQQLERAAVQTEVLRRTDALRVALLSAVAHDLRTPLASIKAAATTLLIPRLAWGAEDRRDFLQAIVLQVDHINDLVTNLLEVSRIEQGHLRPNKESHHIGRVIETVLERLQPTLAAHPVDTSIEPGIPAIPLDAVEIDEALTNLLVNAAEYTGPGTPVHICARRQGETIEVTVADEGPGIPPESLPHLFQRFYRAVPEQQRSTGSHGTRGWGLGLAIVRGIIEAHGGQVTAANGPGGGAVFTLTLPLLPSEENPTPNEATEARHTGSHQEVMS